MDALKIGQLAERTGLTVRALHWYDEIGLLKPSHRTRAGHRLYSKADVVHLQQIKSLQDLGFSLREISDLMKRSRLKPEAVISRHLELLRERIEHLIRLQHRLEVLGGCYRSAASVSIGDLLKTIKEITHMEKYYTPEQLEELRKRREKLGEETIRNAEKEWADLFKMYKAEMEKGTVPEAESVQTLARRSMELIAVFTGGDLGIKQSLGRFYQQESGPDVMTKHGMNVDQAVWDYMGRAMAVLKKTS